MLPLAIEYGMTEEQFWYGEQYLFKAYEIAYQNRNHYNAWLKGKYINLAVKIAINNAFATKKSEIIDYPNYEPLYKYEDCITKDNIDEKQSNGLKSSSDFIKNLLKKR